LPERCVCGGRLRLRDVEVVEGEYWGVLMILVCEECGEEYFERF